MLTECVCRSLLIIHLIAAEQIVTENRAEKEERAGLTGWVRCWGTCIQGGEESSCKGEQSRREELLPSTKIKWRRAADIPAPLSPVPWRGLIYNWSLGSIAWLCRAEVPQGGCQQLWRCSSLVESPRVSAFTVLAVEGCCLFIFWFCLLNTFWGTGLCVVFLSVVRTRPAASVSPHREKAAESSNLQMI